MEAPMFKQYHLERNDNLEDAFKRGADTIRRKATAAKQRVVEEALTCSCFKAGQGGGMKLFMREKNLAL